MARPVAAPSVQSVYQQIDGIANTFDLIRTSERGSARGSGGASTQRRGKSQVMHVSLQWKKRLDEYYQVSKLNNEPKGSKASSLSPAREPKMSAYKGEESSRDFYVDTIDVLSSRKLQTNTKLEQAKVARNSIPSLQLGDSHQRAQKVYKTVNLKLNHQGKSK